MVVRPYEERDFNQGSELFKLFQEETLNTYGLKLERDLLKNLALSSLKGKISCFVLEIKGEVVGIIAGQPVTYHLQTAKLFQEMIWFVKKEHRGNGLKLLKYLENWCKMEGFAGIIMAHLSDNIGERLERIYKIREYNFLEKHYLKIFGGNE